MNSEIGEDIVRHQIRYDLEIIANLIKQNSKVLDIGCGNGELLHFLKKERNVDGRGIELSHQLTFEALSKGTSVTQGDAEENLSYYPDGSFDYAILSQTIQATRNPKKMLQEILRIAEFGIVSLPNFANYKNRLHLALKGTMPVSKILPYSWYDTPNIHFCSIKDFEKLCKELNFSINKKIYLTSKHKLSGPFCHELIANLFADYGVFLISKNELCPSKQEEFVFKNGFNFNLKKTIAPCYNDKF